MDRFIARYVMVALSVVGSAILLFSCEREEEPESEARIEMMMTEYSENLSVFLSNGLVFSVNSTLGGRLRRIDPAEPTRPTGRGTAEDPDIPQGRPFREVEEEPTVKEPVGLLARGLRSERTGVAGRAV